MAENSLKISEMASDERPIEKVFLHGAEYLSDAELLAVLLKTGTKNRNVVALAQEILNAPMNYKGLIGLHYLSEPELLRIEGVGKTKAATILCLCELSKRMAKTVREEKIRFQSPGEIAGFFMEELRFLEKECVFAIFMDGSNRMLKYIKLSEGTVKRSLVPIRELFLEAFRYRAVYMVLVHNHPSGNPEPSEADIQITKRIAELGKQLEIHLLDHIVIGDQVFSSMAERGIIL